MISDEEIKNGVDDYPLPLEHYEEEVFAEGARFGSRLERIKTLEEVRKNFEGQALNGHVLAYLDSLIKQAKSE